VALSDLTPLILTYNEEANIGRCLAGLAWASQICVVDSGSTDRTLELIAAYPQARVIQRTFDSHAGQANFGLSQITTRWVLSLDADYILTPEFQEALRAGEFPEDPGCVYFAPFRFCVYGRPLRGSLYPPRGVLYAREHAAYEQDGHAHRLRLAGRRAIPIRQAILHDDRKSMARWLQSQQNYAALEAAKLRAVSPRELGLPDRLRRTGWAAPLAIVPYTLLVQGLILDGWPGISYAAQRGYAELLLALYLLDARLRPASTEVPPG
jgi:glycosyltransferase involved in cell wall biosynthesis